MDLFSLSRHNDLQNRTAGLLHQICFDVRSAPPLHILNFKTFRNRISNIRDKSGMDISAAGFWMKIITFFDISAFSSMPQCMNKKLSNNVSKPVSWQRKLRLMVGWGEKQVNVIHVYSQCFRRETN